MALIVYGILPNVHWDPTACQKKQKLRERVGNLHDGGRMT